MHNAKKCCYLLYGQMVHVHTWQKQFVAPRAQAQMLKARVAEIVQQRERDEIIQRGRYRDTIEKAHLRIGDSEPPVKGGSLVMGGNKDAIEVIPLAGFHLAEPEKSDHPLKNRKGIN